MGVLGVLIMAKFKVSPEIDAYVAKLDRLGAKTDDMIGRAIYPGAKIVADKIHANIQALPIVSPGKRGTPENPIDGVTAVQKEGLLDGLGIAKAMNKNGFINVKIGFSGYNRSISTTAKKAGWSSQFQANSLIARAVEGGTSFRKKHPFVAPAVRSTRDAAIKAMEEEFDAELKGLGF